MGLELPQDISLKSPVLNATSALTFSSQLLTSYLTFKKHIEFLNNYRKMLILLSRNPQFDTNSLLFYYIPLHTCCVDMIVSAQILHPCLHNTIFQFFGRNLSYLPILCLAFMAQVIFFFKNPIFYHLINGV